MSVEVYAQDYVAGMCMVAMYGPVSAQSAAPYEVAEGECIEQLCAKAQALGANVVTGLKIEVDVESAVVSAVGTASKMAAWGSPVQTAADRGEAAMSLARKAGGGER